MCHKDVGISFKVSTGRLSQATQRFLISETAGPN